MSYGITINGHSPEPHNDKVKEIFEEAVRKARAIPGATSTTGNWYSGDNSGSASGKAEDVV